MKNRRFSENDWDEAIDLFDSGSERNAPLWMQQANPEAHGEREAFYLTNPWSSFREKLAGSLQSSSLRRRMSLNLWVSGLGLAASCAVVLMLVLPKQVEKQSLPAFDSGIREKGAASELSTQQALAPPVLRVMHGSVRIVNGALMKPGDQIKFAVDTMDYDHVFIFGIEENGALSAYYPEMGQSLMVGQTNGLVMPDTIELDDSVGKERFVALFSKRALSWTRIEQLARQKWLESGKDVRTMAGLGLPETEESALWFVKQPSH